MMAPGETASHSLYTNAVMCKLKKDMEEYKTRKIHFEEIVEIDNWKVKIYTISKIGKFDHHVFYNNVLKQLPKWLKQENSFDASNDKIAFLILHSGTEGIFSLINL